MHLTMIREIIMAVIARNSAAAGGSSVCRSSRTRSSSGGRFKGVMVVVEVVAAVRRDSVRSEWTKGCKRKDALPLHPHQIYHRLAVMCVMNFRLSSD